MSEPRKTGKYWKVIVCYCGKIWKKVASTNNKKNIKEKINKCWNCS